MSDSMENPDPATRGITIPRGLLVGAGAVLIVLLIGIAMLVGVLIGSGGSKDPEAQQPSSATRQPSSRPPVASEPAPVAEPASTVYEVGDTFTTGNVTLTIHSVEVVDSIATTSGSPLTPDAGGQLVLIMMTYNNSKTQADLSCGNTDLYLQMFDTEEREMAPVFETARIPGNPGCNDHQLQGVSHEWNIAFQSVAGVVPLAMSVTETDKWLDPVWVDLQ